MSATVFITDFSANWKKSVSSKIADLFLKLEPEKVLNKKDLTAVKLHFGERGNMAYIRPQYVRRIVDVLTDLGVRPFLTDTNTLYVGSRAEAHSHLLTAYDNGFTREVTGAPVIISDGLRGNSRVSLATASRHFHEAHFAADIVHADAMVVLSHFKAHELSGFGGALKNVGMGCASREGKLAQHSNISPKVKRSKCIGCGECTVWCRGGAIVVTGDGAQRKAHINPEHCVGCAECILACPSGAVQIQWNESIPVFMEKMVDYASALLSQKNGKVLYMTFVSDVSPLCDCVPFSDRPIVPDLGILASFDPVAIDQAAVDLVNSVDSNPISGLKEPIPAGGDKFGALFPQVDWEHQLAYAESIGLGTRSYDWVSLEASEDRK